VDRRRCLHRIVGDSTIDAIKFDVAAIEQIRAPINRGIDARPAARRRGLGTSTSGMAEQESARVIVPTTVNGRPAVTIVNGSGFTLRPCGTGSGRDRHGRHHRHGCSASAKVFASGRRMIDDGI